MDGFSHSRPNVKSTFDDAAYSPDGSDAEKEHESRLFTGRPGVKTLNDFIPSEGVVCSVIIRSSAKDIKLTISFKVSETPNFLPHNCDRVIHFPNYTLRK